MTVLLGGRVAEQVVFGAITTGASDDLKRVADISHSMVHDFAMGTAGVGRSPDGDVRLSETTLRIRDEERQDLIEEARRAAQKLIVAHRRQLDALARRAARARGARPRGDRADHGGRAAPGARAGRGAARGGRAPQTPRRCPDARLEPRTRQPPAPRARSGSGRAIDCGGCSAASTTSAWPSRRSRPRSSSTATASSCSVAHREVVQRAGRGGGAARRRREPRRAAGAARAGHAGGEVPGEAGPGPAPRRLPGRATSTRRSPALKQAGMRADRRAARASASAARAWRSCTRARPAAC